MTYFEISYIIKQILLGLEEMHKCNIMHRDLKPENILLRKKNALELVIGDLGLATNSTDLPYLYVKCGTPGYVAPEVLNI